MCKKDWFPSTRLSGYQMAWIQAALCLVASIAPRFAMALAGMIGSFGWQWVTYVNLRTIQTCLYQALQARRGGRHRRAPELRAKPDQRLAAIHIRQPQRRALRAGFRLAVDRCFTQAGAGTVVGAQAVANAPAALARSIALVSGTPSATAEAKAPLNASPAPVESIVSTRKPGT